MPRELRSLPIEVRERLLRTIRAFTKTPRPPGAMRLKTHAHRERSRVDQYPIIYAITDRIQVVLVIDVGHRRDIYQR